MTILGELISLEIKILNSLIPTFLRKIIPSGLIDIVCNGLSGWGNAMSFMSIIPKRLKEKLVEEIRKQILTKLKERADQAAVYIK
jgi:hypothetical protein